MIVTSQTVSDIKLIANQLNDFANFIQGLASADETTLEDAVLAYLKVNMPYSLTVRAIGTITEDLEGDDDARLHNQGTTRRLKDLPHSTGEFVGAWHPAHNLILVEHPQLALRGLPKRECPILDCYDNLEKWLKANGLQLEGAVTNMMRYIDGRWV